MSMARVLLTTERTKVIYRPETPDRVEIWSRGFESCYCSDFPREEINERMAELLCSMWTAQREAGSSKAECRRVVGYFVLSVEEYPEKDYSRISSSKALLIAAKNLVAKTRKVRKLEVREWPFPTD